MAPYFRVTSYPPLGQLTVIPARHEQLSFVVLVEWSRTRPDHPLELFLCYTSSTSASNHPSTWTTVPLSKSANPSIAGREDAFRSTFHYTQSTTSLAQDTGKDIRFTVKYRVDDLAPWQWVQSEQGTAPGRVLIQGPNLPLQQDFSQFLVLDPDWHATQISGVSKDANLYKLESSSPIPRSDTDENEERLFTSTLGTIPHLLQYFAVIRLEPYWLGPRQGKEHFYLAEDALLCSFLTSTGQILTIVTLSGVENTHSVLQSNEKGEIVVAARCDNDEDVPFHAVLSIANTLEKSCTAAMTACSQIAGSQKLSTSIARNVHAKSTQSDAVFDKWVDGLSFCTWNGLGQNLTEDKILSALSSLEASKINIATLLIDDNWQRLAPIPNHDFADSFCRGFSDLPCNQDVAPEGLPALIKKIKTAHPNIVDIGLWHALMGYWAGISPSGQIAKEYATTQAPTYLIGNLPATITSVAGSALEKFYDDFYSYLSGSGVTFVKTDVQHMPTYLRSRSSRLELTEAYQYAWTKAHNKYFNSKAISCMSSTPQQLYASLLQTHTPKVILRNSDDFFPEIAASHPWHIWVNAHNSIFTQHLNVCPDWDMFQTVHSFSSYHAASRCLSGGPIMITDVPGEHDVALIKQMVALDKNGRSIALRPGLARTIRVFDEYAEGHILKIGSTTITSEKSNDDSASAFRASLLGLFNIAERTESTLIPITEFSDIHSIASSVLVRSFQTGQTFGPIHVTNPAASTSNSDGNDEHSDIHQLIYTILPTREWDILTAYPVFQHLSNREDFAIAVLGLTDKMSGAAGVLSVDVIVDAENNSATENDRKEAGGTQADTVKLKVTLKALGKLTLWVQGLRSADTNVGGTGPNDNDLLEAVSVKLQSEPILAENLALEAAQGSERDGERQKESNVNGPKQGYSSIFTIDVEKEWTRMGFFDREQADIVVDISVRI